MGQKKERERDGRIDWWRDKEMERQRDGEMEKLRGRKTEDRGEER